MSTTEPPPTVGEAAEAEEPASDQLPAGNELVADSLGEYLSGQWKRMKAGESGALPVVVGLLIIVIIFQVQNSKFLSTGNLTNLIEQAGVFVLLGMAEVFVLLLGEIDLSTGFVAGVGAVVTGELATTPHNVNWFLAVLAGLATCAVIGVIQGLLITRLGLPSFIVTLAGLLGWSGFLLWLIEKDKNATGGTIAVTNNVLNDLVNGSMSAAAGWITMIVAVGLYGAVSIYQTQRRRRSGLVTPPLALVLLKIAGLAGAGIILVLVCNANRGFNGTQLLGVPWIVPILLVVLVIYSILLGRMPFGRHLYAIGGNAEAARRAGISLNRVRLLAFMLCSFTAGLAGMIYLSQLGSISSGIAGGNLVLYAVAAAVIGGTSLFGGRGKMSHAVIGGFVITTIYNGMGLIQIGPAGQSMVIALVLLAAVTVDSLARRGRS
ncbi:MAG TPA: ABC transporter permease [Mycobacteriales bacterium]|nr:ABC transporter permease [Mycobacteriales bacterium]